MGVVSGFLKRKRYKRKDNGDYQLASYWTSSNTVEFDDNETAQTKVNQFGDSGKIKYVSVVDTLPADAADHPTTLYLVKE